jgi:hypothetical protein
MSVMTTSDYGSLVYQTMSQSWVYFALIYLYNDIYIKRGRKPTATCLTGKGAYAYSGCGLLPDN